MFALQLVCGRIKGSLSLLLIPALTLSASAKGLPNRGPVANPKYMQNAQLEVKKAIGKASAAPGPKILPKTSKASTLKETVGFILAKSPKGLLVYFYSKDPQLYLDKTHPYVVSFTSHFPLDVTPSLLTQKTWPKNSEQAVVSVRSVSPKIHGGLITAKAAFTYCHKTKKSCWQGSNLLELLYDG